MKNLILYLLRQGISFEYRHTLKKGEEVIIRDKLSTKQWDGVQTCKKNPPPLYTTMRHVTPSKRSEKKKKEPVIRYYFVKIK